MNFFKKVKVTKVVNLGTTSRTGGISKISIPQVDANGDELVGVSTQEPIITSAGKALKIRCPYYKNILDCYSIENEKTGEFGTEIVLTPKTEKVSKYAGVEIPQQALNLESNGRIPKFDYKKVDENGKVIEEMKWNSSYVSKYKDGSIRTQGRYEIHCYDKPIYFERYSMRGEEIKIEDNKGNKLENGGTDDKGNYVKSFERFSHMTSPNSAIMLELGVALTEAGTEIKGTEGVYVIPSFAVGSDGQKNINALLITPQKSSGRVSISSKLNKVLKHPLYGVLRADQVDNGSIIDGTFQLELKPVKVGVFNDEGVVAFKTETAYKISKFKQKGSRTLNIDKVEGEVKESIKDSMTESKAEATTSEVETDDYFA